MAADGTNDHGLTRRGFLKTGGLAMVSIGAGGAGFFGGPLFLHRAALAASETGPFGRRKVLVFVFLRGAMDGLSAVPPIDDPRLRSLRPGLALDAAAGAGEDRLVDLGVGFGLHPALEPLLPLWRDGRLGIVHGTGSPDPTRSHFDAQDYMETGTPGRKGTRSGWLNRVAGRLGHEVSPFRAVAMSASMPRSLSGPESAVAVGDLSRFAVRLDGAGEVARRAGRGFEALYDGTAAEVLRETGARTFEAVELLERAGLSGYRPVRGARYPRSSLGSALRQIAFLVKSDLGLEVAFAESGGWDTHVRQGAANGTFARRARDLAESIRAFWTDLGSRQSDVVVLTATEFGRTVAENGSGGTDHGHGSCLFVVGDRIEGARVHGELPPLAPENLSEGRDLPVTTDFRSVFTEVATGHLGIGEDAGLFPGWSGEPLELFRG